MKPRTFHRARRLWHLLTINPHRSYRELEPLLGVHSKCAVHHYLSLLERLGYIQRRRDRCRSIIVLVPFGSMEVL